MGESTYIPENSEERFVLGRVHTLLTNPTTKPAEQILPLLNLFLSKLTEQILPLLTLFVSKPIK
jgi:hypothetical protein